MASAKPAVVPFGVQGQLGCACDDGAGGAHRDDHLAAVQLQGQGRRRVVTRAGAHQHAVPAAPLGPQGAGGLGRAQHARQPGDGPEPRLEQLRAVVVLRGVVVPRAGGVRTVRDERAAQLQREPVVGEHDAVHARGGLRLVLAQPRELGQCHGGHGRHAHALHPPAGAVLRRHAGGLGGAADVVPQQGVPHGGACGIHRDHAVLLPGHGDAHDVVAPGDPRLPPRRVQRVQPRGGVCARAVRVRGTAAREHLAAVRVHDHDLARLRGGVDADNGAAHGVLPGNEVGAGQGCGATRRSSSSRRAAS